MKSLLKQARLAMWSSLVIAVVFVAGIFATVSEGDRTLFPQLFVIASVCMLGVSSVARIQVELIRHLTKPPVEV